MKDMTDPAVVMLGEILEWEAALPFERTLMAADAGHWPLLKWDSETKPKRGCRRHHAIRKMKRRLKEDRNEHYNDLDCPCWTDPKAMARFKEQPQRCSCWGCGNQRRHEGPTLQERRHAAKDDA